MQITQAQHAKRQEWLAALRSGKYQQTEGILHSAETGGFCCLGVACDISGIGKWNEDSNFVGELFIAYSLPPDEIRTLFGLWADGLVSEAVDKNDEQRKSFPEIADWLEEQFAKDEVLP